MRAIERVIAGILLVAAVCGSAVFARSIGQEATAGSESVQLTVAPREHVQSARPIEVTLHPLLTDLAKPAAKPRLDDVAVFGATPAAAPGTVVTPVMHRPAPPARVEAPAQEPLVGQPENAPATPTTSTQRSASRILARAPLTPTPTWAHVKGIGHGKLKNHPDEEAVTPPVQQQQSGSLTPQSSSTITVVVLAPAPPAEADDDSNGREHVYGRLKQAHNDHD